MSISKFQEKFLAKGCGTAILIGCAAVFGALAFSYFGKGSGGGSDANGQPIKIFANVGGIPVPATAIEQALQHIQQQQQQGADPTSTPPSVQVGQYGEALDGILNHAAVLSIAKQAGVSPTDDQIRDAAKADLARRIEMNKLQMEMQGQLKPGATDADFDAIMKSQLGKSLSEFEKQQLASLDATLKDPDKRPAAVEQFTEPILISTLAARTVPVDAEVKASYDQDTFKRVLLREKPAPSPTTESRIAQVEKDLAGGATFEQVMDRYSDEAPMAKKKPSDNQQVLTPSQIDSDKALGALKGLKVGSVSAPVKTPEGTSIYKLISVKNQAPADFDKNIAKYRQRYQEAKAKSTVDEQSKQILTQKTEWLSKGYKAAYDVTRPDVDASKAQALYEEAKAAIAKTEGYDLRPAQLAEYAAFDLIWSAPTADKVKLRPERIQVLNDYLQNMENFSVRMELVGLYQDDKNGPAAAECLAAAARSNNSYDQIGFSHFGDVAARLMQLRSSGAVTAEQAKAIEDVQAQWKKDKAEFDAAQAKQRADDEAARKKAMEEEKKARDDAKKAKASAAPTGKDATGATKLPDVLTKPSSTPASGAPLPGGASSTAGGFKN